MDHQVIELQGNAKLVITESLQDINSLPKEKVLNWIKQSGTVIFRGFNCDIEAFSGFVAQNSSRVTLDPARQFHAKSVQKVDAGTDEVGLHCENGNAPKLPDFIWFFCKKAARQGSETTYCNGVEVWNKLSAATKQLFLSKKIKYARTVPESLWKSYLLHELPGVTSVDEISSQHLELMANASPGQSFKLNEDQSVYYEFSTAAVHPTLFSEQLSFANSLLGPSYNYQKPSITFEDNQDIPADVIKEVQQVTEEHTHNIEWQKNDIALIDNTRFMHGRREILDNDREIYSALSYL